MKKKKTGTAFLQPVVTAVNSLGALSRGLRPDLWATGDWYLTLVPAAVCRTREGFNLREQQSPRRGAGGSDASVKVRD